MVYLTFILKPCKRLAEMGCDTIHFAIKAVDEMQAWDAASDIYSIDGLSHMRVNKCGRLHHKDVVIMKFGTDYEKQINDAIEKQWNQSQ